MGTKLVAALPLFLVSTALAQSVQEFLIPRANAFPHDPEIAADGTAWYTDQSNSYIGRLDATTRTFQDWPTPSCGTPTKTRSSIVCSPPCPYAPLWM